MINHGLEAFWSGVCSCDVKNTELIDDFFKTVLSNRSVFALIDRFGLVKGFDDISGLINISIYLNLFIAIPGKLSGNRSEQFLSSIDASIGIP